MKSYQKILILLGTVLALDFLLFSKVFAQTPQLTTEEWVIVTLVGFFSPVIIIPVTNLLKKIPGMMSINGISSITSTGVSFLLVWIADKITATHLPLVDLWFLTLNLQTFSQMVYSIKPNFQKKAE